MKGQVLHHERTHLKVSGCSFVLNALLANWLTKKLPTFLSRLNEINCGWENILPVSGSFWSNLKLHSLSLFILIITQSFFLAIVKGNWSLNSSRENCLLNRFMFFFPVRNRKSPKVLRIAAQSAKCHTICRFFGFADVYIIPLIILYQHALCIFSFLTRIAIFS